MTTHNELAVLSGVENASQLVPANFSKDSGGFLLSPAHMEFILLPSSQLGHVEGSFGMEGEFLPGFWKLLSMTHAFCSGISLHPESSACLAFA